MPHPNIGSPTPEELPNLDGGMEAKEGPFADKLRSNAAYLMSFHDCLTHAEAKVIADKLDRAADMLSASSERNAPVTDLMAELKKKLAADPLSPENIIAASASSAKSAPRIGNWEQRGNVINFETREDAVMVANWLEPL